MKALSIRQPWADLLVEGSRTVEIRTWSTRHRGPLLLHASGAYGIPEREASARLGRPRPDPTRLAAVLGIAELVDCRPVQAEDWESAMRAPLEGRLWAWVFAQPRSFEPVPHPGNRTLFEIEDSVVSVPAAPA